MDRLFPSQVETAKLILREPQLSDAATIFQTYGQDPMVAKYMMWEPNPDPSGADSFIAEAIEHWSAGARFAFVLELKSEGGKLVGMLDARIDKHIVDFGYVLARDFWGQGLMPEALSALSELALEHESIFRLQASCDVENEASMRTLEKCGYVREGRLDRYVLHPNIHSEPRPCFMYALCK